LRIAIHNHYAGQEVAETEFSKRICYAISNLGWEAVEVGSSAEIKHFDPDFVIALHFRTPKLTKYPTYGSMVTPPVYFAQEDQFLKNILSYDGYLSSSDHISSWLRDILYHTPKKHFIAPWYTACHNVPYRRPQITKPRLLYTGTNWDGPRYRELFERLDAEPYVDIYGPTNAWCYLKNSFRGLLPFDGISMFDALHSAGVGLCLHRKEHCDAATPSSRIFEIVASGAIAICQDHPFIRENFGDSVLYLDPAGETAAVSQQISKYMHWIAENQEQAFNLSKRAYDIYSKKYTLEKLLSELVPHHERIVAQKNIRRAPTGARKDNGVQFIVRVGDRESTYVERALDSLSSQTYGSTGVLLVQYGDVPNLRQLLKKYDEQLHIKILNVPYNGFRSTQLWAGLQAVSAEYFGILDDDDVIHPYHVDSLLQLLERSDNYGVAYSGSIRIWESRHGQNELQPSDEVRSEPAELTYFEPFDLNRLVALNNFITSNAFIARSSLLKDLGDDPRLPLLEDLFLLLHLCRKAAFVFSYEATCEFYWRHHRDDNTVLLDQEGWVIATERIKDILWKQSFHSTQNVAHNLAQQEQKLSGLESRLLGLEHGLLGLEHGLLGLEHRLLGPESRLSGLEHKLAQVEISLTQTNTKIEGIRTRLNRYLNSPVIDAVRRFRRMLFRLPPP
jgi:glycosyl transferase family 2